MAAVGLLYVGAVLFVNAMMLLGRVDPRAAAVMNLMVGGLQVVTPTYLIIAANGDVNQIAAASGIYLFGFTYLYVGVGLLTGLDSTGVGYFSLFVAVAAVIYAAYNMFDVRDYPFGVIWLYWSFLWSLFFVLLGLGRTEFTRFTALVTLVVAWATCVLPAFLLITDRYSDSPGFAAGLAAFGVVVFTGLWLATRPVALRSDSRPKPAGST